MADYTHTIDRWDEATGENLIGQIAAAAVKRLRAKFIPHPYSRAPAVFRRT
jgi:hypothetical protein